jgi:hypothetical protein
MLGLILILDRIAIITKRLMDMDMYPIILAFVQLHLRASVFIRARGTSTGKKLVGHGSVSGYKLSSV